MALGDFVRKWETGGVGTSGITNDDSIGGAAYGTFQLSSNKGSARNFVNYLRTAMPTAYAALAPNLGSMSLGTRGGFGQAWLQLAKDPEFQKAERDFGFRSYLGEVLPKISNQQLRDRIAASEVLQNVLLSTATQHGQGGGAKIFNSVLRPDMSDEDIIRAVYGERGRTDANGRLVHFYSSPQFHKGLTARFKGEMNDALAALGATGNTTTPTSQMPPQPVQPTPPSSYASTAGLTRPDLSEAQKISAREQGLARINDIYEEIANAPRHSNFLDMLTAQTNNLAAFNQANGFARPTMQNTNAIPSLGWNTVS